MKSRLWKRTTQFIFHVQTKEFLITGSTEDHNEEFNDLYSSPNIVRVIKSRRMRWARHVARMGEKRGVYRVLVGENLWKETAWETQA
jgi:hypothetical protein